MNADGSNPVRLTFDNHPDQEPDWSPDGSKIVFDSNRDGNAEIWVMRASRRLVSNITSSTDLGAVLMRTPTAWKPKITLGEDIP